MDYIDIPRCPRCKQEHRYQLNVARTVVMKLMRTSDMNEQPRVVRFTRLFTCPVKNEDFQATFTLTDYSSARIENVEVVGVANDNKER